MNVQEISPVGQQSWHDCVFPLAYGSQSTALSDALKWVQSQRERLDTQLRAHGAILFRGFSVHTADDLDAFIRAFEYPNFRYQDSLSNAVRVNRTERVFTANEAPPEVTIFFAPRNGTNPDLPESVIFLL